jgi:ABC-2 type transport system permease protein
VAGKELRVLWASPVPYVVGALLQLVLALLYVDQLTARRQALFQPVVPIAGFLLLAVTPIVCMRAVAEEARAGTLELLQAVPVPGRPLAVGKWLAAWLTVLVVLAPVLLFVLLLEWFGSPDMGPVLAGLAGLALLAGALAGLGVLASSLTSSQPVAAMTAFFVSLLLWFAHVRAETLSVGGVMDRLSISERLRGFAGGVVDSSDVAFFALLAAVALVLAATAIDARRMR